MAPREPHIVYDCRSFLDDHPILDGPAGYWHYYRDAIADFAEDKETRPPWTIPLYAFATADLQMRSRDANVPDEEMVVTNWLDRAIGNYLEFE